MQVRTATHAYVAINDQGEARAIVMDDEFKKDTAKSVADWIKRGYRVEYLPIAEAHARFAKREAPSQYFDTEKT
jgi:hypothetical protein